MATRKKSRHVVRRTAVKATRRPTRKAGAPARAARSSARRAITARKQPETLRLRSVTPTLTVNDLERSIAWYCDGLGFLVADRWEENGALQGVMLKAGGCSFYLVQDDFAKGRDRQKGVGFRIYADTAQDIDALAERIRAYGGKITMEPSDTSWGTRSFGLEDPDGFALTLSKAR